MDLSVHSLGLASSFFSKSIDFGHGVKSSYESKSCSFVDAKSKERRRRRLSVQSSALLETAASVAIAATVVGAAATLLVQRTKASDTKTEIPMKVCENCRGSGICPECRGEGFVLKKLSDQSAEKARLTASNAATRYTAGLPKKWSYCTKCSSSRSCLACDGRGKISL